MTPPARAGAKTFRVFAWIISMGTNVCPLFDSVMIAAVFQVNRGLENESHINISDNFDVRCNYDLNAVVRVTDNKSL